ncbi:MAG: hypothetical protein GKR94_09255 [Gammaproteobacteria bacterium]|nr:hypothetical protein [Gammaproteobacteria bacterium]
MTRIAQLQVSYSALEDRLLLRLSTDNRLEFRFWVTQRYLKLLQPVLTEIVESSGRAAMIPDQATRKTVTEFERETALVGADFQTEFNEAAASLPLGEAPVLLARIQKKVSPTGSPVLCLHPQSGMGVEVVLDPQLLHSLISLLSNGAIQADWGAAQNDGGQPLAAGESRVLN